MSRGQFLQSIPPEDFTVLRCFKYVFGLRIERNDLLLVSDEHIQRRGRHIHVIVPQTQGKGPDEHAGHAGQAPAGDAAPVGH